MKSFFQEKVEAGADPTDTLNQLRPKSRDNSRTPMQWSAEINGGFTTGKPWIGVNPNHIEINAEEQENDPRSVLQFYRRLIAFRREHPCLVLGSFDTVPGDNPSLLSYRRSLPEESLLVLLNLSSEYISLRPDFCPGHEHLLGNYAGYHSDGLRPWEARIALLET